MQAKDPTDTKTTRRNFLAAGGSFIALKPLRAAINWPAPPPTPSTRAGAPFKLPNGTLTYPYLPPEQRVGFAIVGLGALALGEILPAMAECRMARPTALVSGDPAKAARVAKQYGISEKSIYSYETYDRMIDDPSIQVVYNVLPNSMHKEYTLRAFKAGKHVLCEKPLGVDAKDAAEIVAAGREAKLKLMVAYRQQYEPNNRYVRELIRNKTFGPLKLFHANNSQMEPKSTPKPWRLVKALAGGGALPDIGLYCLNAARFLSGEEPYEVQALQYSTPRDPRFTEVEEAIAWTMKFPSGLIAMCSSSYGAFNNKDYHFVAENGSFGLAPAFGYRGLRARVNYKSDGIEHEDHPTQPDANQFALEMDHMADCVRSKKEPHTPGEEGLQDHKIMDAIYQSARDGKPVALERITQLDKFRPPTL